MNFYAFNIGDYAGATRHLSWDEDMAYRRMLDAYYSREEPLPLEPRQVYRLVGASEQRQREAVDTVLEEFFERRNDGWYNNRADEEIAKAQLKKEKARQSAEKRWQSDGTATAPANHANASKVDANAQRPQSEGNAPNPNPNPNPNKEDDEDTRARKRLDFEKLESALHGITELKDHPVRTAPVLAPILKLVTDEGYDIVTQIIPSVRRQAAAATKPIKGWSYFVAGIRQDAETPVLANGASHGSRTRRLSNSEKLNAAFDHVDELIARGDQGSRD